MSENGISKWLQYIDKNDDFSNDIIVDTEKVYDLIMIILMIRWNNIGCASRQCHRCRENPHEFPSIIKIMTIIRRKAVSCCHLSERVDKQPGPCLFMNIVIIIIIITEVSEWFGIWIYSNGWDPIWLFVFGRYFQTEYYLYSYFSNRIPLGFFSDCFKYLAEH